MKIYNTLGRQLQDFSPLESETVKLYTCGPTVYDYAHIGNLRSFVFDDTLRRTLEINGYNVKHVMNITDVGHLVSDADEGEDKLESGAKRENKSVWDVADFFIGSFLKDMEALNVQPPTVPGKDSQYARATDYIDEQLTIIGILTKKGFAYITQAAIYFDVTKLNDYGKLTGQKLTDKEIGARDDVVTDPGKRSPQDFALWFFKQGRFANHSMAWNSQWGEGFPGWHLECSAIIHALLSEPLDIHTGGVDHIGTHHTNEIAQSEAAFGGPLSEYWMHNEHLLVDGAKMSKSAGNYYTLRDVIAKGYEPLALRLMFLQSHYRSQSNFSWDTLAAAQTRLMDFRALGALRWQLYASGPKSDIDFEQITRHIKSQLDNDLNTPMALTALSGASDLIKASAPATAIREDFEKFLYFVDKVFGLELLGISDITDDQKKLLAERASARKQNDWTRADSIRHALKEQGIGINDTGDKQIWHPL